MAVTMKIDHWQISSGYFFSCNLPIGDGQIASGDGPSCIVATENFNEAYTSFTVVTRLRQGVTPQDVFLERDREDESSLTHYLGGKDVEANARERSATVGVNPSQPSSVRDNDSPAAIVLSRSHTALATSSVSRTGLPTCVLTVRKPGVNDVSPASVSLKPSE